MKPQHWVIVIGGGLLLASLAWFAPVLWCSTSLGMSGNECTDLYGGNPFSLLGRGFWSRLVTLRL